MCDAGTYYSYGSCYYCGYGTYQPNYNSFQLYCYSCPYGETTSYTGAADSSYCIVSSSSTLYSLIVIPIFIILVSVGICLRRRRNANLLANRVVMNGQVPAYATGYPPNFAPQGYNPQVYQGQNPQVYQQNPQVYQGQNPQVYQGQFQQGFVQPPPQAYSGMPQSPMAYNSFGSPPMNNGGMSPTNNGMQMPLVTQMK